MIHLGDFCHGQDFCKEFIEEYKFAGYMVCPEDPLYSVVALEGTTITIEGVESKMYCGVELKDIGFPEFDRVGRKFEPRTQSAKITLG